MNKKTQIVIHLLPTELEEFEAMSSLLKESFSYLEDLNCVEAKITFNLSSALFDWNKSSISKNDLIVEFESIIQKYYDEIEKTIEIRNSDEMYGTTAQKRDAIESCPDYIDQLIFLDTDIRFHPATLYLMLEASKSITSQYYVLTPQTVKLWDETWDCITHDKFIDEPYGFYQTFDVKNVADQEYGSSGLTTIQTFKFGCGWFTLYSKSLLKFIGIPKELGAYGSEDTFLMFASIEMKNFGYDIEQYVINGLYIAEKYFEKKSSYTNELVKKSMKESFYVKHNTEEFSKALSNFITNLRNNKI